MKINKIVLVISVVAAVMLIAAAVLLYQSISQYRDVSGQLNLSRRQLIDLYQRNPFPSEENIETEREYLAILRQEWSDLLADLAEGQVEPVQTSPTRFLEMFRDTSRQLVETADRRDIGLPDDAAFGFQRHLAGQLPGQADVPRLIQQLAIVEQLVNTLYDVRVERINAVRRQEFEASETSSEPRSRPATGAGMWGETATTRRPAAAEPAQTEPPHKVGILREGTDYASMRFSLDVTLRENNLRELLNALATHSMFIVVTQVEVENPFTWQPARALTAASDAERDEAPEAAPPSARTAQDAPLPRSARVATGGIQTPFRVRIDLEVYRFRKDEAS